MKTESLPFPIHRWLPRLAFLLILLLASAVTPALAAPTGTITVNTLSDNNISGDGFCTLREAITRANAGAPTADCPGATAAPNAIIFSVNGTITLASTLPTITGALTITGNGPANTIIEASATPNTASYRVFTFNSASAFQLSDLTLRNGATVAPGTSGGCLSLLASGATLTLTNTVFSHCIAGGSGGGAIAAANGGTINVSTSTFSNNTSANGTSGGGAIYINGNLGSASLTISDSVFNNNSLTSTASGQAGGAVSCIICVLSITNTTFDGNSAATTATNGTTGGGALYINTDLTVGLSGVTFTNNTAAASGTGTTISYGGALYVSSQRAVALTIADSVFSGNSLTAGATRRGGAISLGDGTLTLTSSRLVSNSANGNGDALYGSSPLNVTIRQSCITGNGTSAVYDSGASGIIDATGGGNAANANWWGTLWGPRIAAAGGGSAVSNGDAINGNGDTVLGNILVDVNLTDPGTPGTPPTGEWLTSAPTVAGALCETFPAPALPDVTVSPASFNVNEGANADFTLTRTGSTASDLVVSVDITLGTGMAASDYTLSGGSITGQSGSQTVTIPAGQASVAVNFAAADDADAEADNTLTLALVDGADYNLGAPASSTATIPANDLVVTNTNNSGDGSLRQAISNANAFAGDDTITFNVNNATILLSSEINLTSNMTIDGSGNSITLSGGNTTRIFNLTGSPTVALIDLTFTSGHPSSGNGGAILASATSTLNVTDSTFTSNIAAQGGGIYTTGSLTVTGSSFSGNNATGATGSAICAHTGAPSPTITDSTFTNNASGAYAVWFNLVTGTASISNSVFSGNGGGFGGSGTINFTNNTFTNNNSSVGGGALYLGSGTHTFTNNTISGNHSNNSNAAGGIYSIGNSTDGNANVILRNTILANNTHSAAPDCRSGTLSSITVNDSLIEDPTNCVFTGSNNITLQDPNLGAFTGVYLPLNPDSPAIDAANAANCPTTDQRGESRTADLACDMGAYEMQYADSDTVSRPASASALTTFGPTLVGIQNNGGDDPGVITVLKSFTWNTQPDNTIDGYWTITPSSGSTYNLTLQLCYAPGELPAGLNEADLRFWRYSGGVWSQVGPASLTWTSVNSNRCASVSGITGFSSWTLGGSDAPTALTLTAFSATSVPGAWEGWVIALLLILGGTYLWLRRTGLITKTK